MKVINAYSYLNVMLQLLMLLYIILKQLPHCHYEKVEPHDDT